MRLNKILILYSESIKNRLPNQIIAAGHNNN